MNSTSSASVGLVAGVASSAVYALVTLFALPFYVKYLGMEAYGLIGFYITLQGLAQIMDFGMVSTVTREVARRIASGVLADAADLVRSAAVLYLIPPVFFILLAFFAGPLLVKDWLSSTHLSSEVLLNTVVLMGANLAFRWPIGLYNGALTGANRLVYSSAIAIASNILAATASILALIYGNIGIEGFFLIQVVCGMLQVSGLYYATRRVLGRGSADHRLWEPLRGVWSYSAWVAFVSITSLAFTQLDKVVLSQVLPLDKYGAYMIAVTVAGFMQIIVMPVYGVIFPRFTKAIALNDESRLQAMYSFGSRLLASVLFPSAVFVGLYAQPLVAFWTGNQQLAAQIAPLIQLLLIGSSLNGLMNFPYALQLASGRPRIPLAINLSLLIVMSPTMFVLAGKFGALGGAIAWAISGCLNAVVGSWVTGQKVMRFAGWSWLVTVILPTTLLATSLGAFGNMLARSMGLNAWGSVAVGLLACIAGVVFCIASGADTRLWAQSLARCLVRRRFMAM